MAAEQKHRITMNEEEFAKEKEKIMKLTGFPLSNMLSHGRDRGVVLEIMNTTARSNLIPRAMETNIIVYLINTDISMQLRNDRRRINTANAGSTINNALAGVRAAIANQNLELVKTMLEGQPDLVNSFDDEGLSPLSYAAYNGFVDIVFYILEKFPKTIYIRNKDRSYPIHKACLGGHVSVLEKFHSKYPESLKSGNNQARTVLHLAAKERGNKLKHVVAYLLTLREGRELINKRDENGCTPLDLARSSRNGEVEEVFRRS